MKAVTAVKYGKHPLVMQDMPVPKIGAKDVLVEVHAASVNPVDYKMRDGDLRIVRYMKPPFIVGCDFSGVVKQVGIEVDNFKEDDEVYGRVDTDRLGAISEYAAIKSENLALKPKNLSFAEAAAVPLAGLTAYQALHDKMHLQKDQKVLIQAGAGGVGHFAVQIAKIIGADVTTTVSKQGESLALKLGADRTIDYKNEDFSAQTNYYDGIFDTIGGETLKKSFKAVKNGGRVVSIAGIPQPQMAKEYDLTKAHELLFYFASRQIERIAKHNHVHYSYLFMHPSGVQLDVLRGWIESGQLKVVIDEIYPFEETQKAFDHVENGSTKGKVVVEVKKA